MAKVKLVGDVNMEFEVKYGLNEEFIIKVHAVPVGDNKYVLIGEGDISHIPPRTLGFIGRRMDKMLEKAELYIGVNGFGRFFRYSDYEEIKEDRELLKAMCQTELGLLIMEAFRWRDRKALKEVLQKQVFPLSISGMEEFISRAQAKNLGYFNGLGNILEELSDAIKESDWDKERDVMKVLTKKLEDGLTIEEADALADLIRNMLETITSLHRQIEKADKLVQDCFAYLPE